MEEYKTYIGFDRNKPGQYRYGQLPMSFLYEPIYVGKGKRHREKDHVKNAKTDLRLGRTSKTPWKKKLYLMLKNDNVPIFEIIASGLEEWESLALEGFLIRSIGKVVDKTGPLYNVVDEDGERRSYTASENHKASVTRNANKMNQMKKDAGGERGYLELIHGIEKADQIIKGRAKIAAEASKKSVKAKAASKINGYNNRGKVRTKEMREHLSAIRTKLFKDPKYKKEAAMNRANNKGKTSQYHLSEELKADLTSRYLNGETKNELLESLRRLGYNPGKGTLLFLPKVEKGTQQFAELCRIRIEKYNERQKNITIAE